MVLPVPVPLVLAPLVLGDMLLVLVLLLVLGDEVPPDAAEPPLLPVLPVLLPVLPLASLRPLFWSLLMLEPVPWLVSRALPSFDF
ncbi:MAG TPA: hypothetical protein VF861_17210 [Telluria sp.]